MASYVGLSAIDADTFREPTIYQALLRLPSIGVDPVNVLDGLDPQENSSENEVKKCQQDFGFLRFQSPRLGRVGWDFTSNPMVGRRLAALPSPDTTWILWKQERGNKEIKETRRERKRTWNV